MKVSVRAIEMSLDAAKARPPEPPCCEHDVAVSSFGTGAALQKRLRDLLWEDPDVRELYRSILENKGLVERIIVRRRWHNRRGQLPLGGL